MYIFCATNFACLALKLSILDVVGIFPFLEAKSWTTLEPLVSITFWIFHELHIVRIFKRHRLVNSIIHSFPITKSNDYCHGSGRGEPYCNYESLLSLVFSWDFLLCVFWFLSQWIILIIFPISSSTSNLCNHFSSNCEVTEYTIPRWHLQQPL